MISKTLYMPLPTLIVLLILPCHTWLPIFKISDGKGRKAKSISYLKQTFNLETTRQEKF